MVEEEIVRYGDEVLKKATQPVEEVNDEIGKLVQHMQKVMAAASGLGLAANQIGVPKRVFVYDVGEGPRAMINPKLLKAKGKQDGVEGCLSVPGLQGEVTRAEVVVVEGLDASGEPVKIQAEGLLARVFQHEMDHLDGVLFVDRADPDTLEFISAGEKADED